MTAELASFNWESIFKVPRIVRHFLWDEPCYTYTVKRREIHVCRFGTKSPHPDSFKRSHSLLASNINGTLALCGFRVRYRRNEYWIGDEQGNWACHTTASKCIKNYLEKRGDSQRFKGKAIECFHITNDCKESTRREAAKSTPLIPISHDVLCFECGKNLAGKKSRFHPLCLVRLCAADGTYVDKALKPKPRPLLVRIVQRIDDDENDDDDMDEKKFPGESEKDNEEVDDDFEDGDDDQVLDGGAFFTYQSIINFVEMVGRCPKCGKALEIVCKTGKYTDRGLRFKCEDDNCLKKYQKIDLRCDDELVRRSSPFSRRFSASVVYNGLSYTDARGLLQCAGIDMPVSQSAFYSFQKTLISKVASLRNQLIDQNVKSRLGQPMRLAIDGRWSSRRQAMDGTVTVCDLNVSPPLPVGVAHIQQNRCRGEKLTITNIGGDPRSWSITGPAKSYEGFGTKQIGQALRDAGADVDAAVLDGDANTFAVLRNIFDEIEYVPDYNHMIKNMPQKIKNQAKLAEYKELYARWPQFVDHYRRMSNYIHSREKMTVDEKRRRYEALVEATVGHLQGDHRLCPKDPDIAPGADWDGLCYACHAVQPSSVDVELVDPKIHRKKQERSLKKVLKRKGKDEESGDNVQVQIEQVRRSGRKKAKDKLIQSEAALDWIRSFYLSYSKSDAQLVRGCSNVIESINSSYARKASKNKDWRVSYRLRCDIALLIYMIGPVETFSRICDLVDLPATSITYKHLVRVETIRDRQKERRQTQEYKTYRALSKKAKKKMLQRLQFKAGTFTYTDVDDKHDAAHPGNSDAILADDLGSE